METYVCILYANFFFNSFFFLHFLVLFLVLIFENQSQLEFGTY